MAKFENKENLDKSYRGIDIPSDPMTYFRSKGIEELGNKGKNKNNGREEEYGGMGDDLPVSTKSISSEEFRRATARTDRYFSRHKDLEYVENLEQKVVEYTSLEHLNEIKEQYLDGRDDEGQKYVEVLEWEIAEFERGEGDHTPFE